MFPSIQVHIRVVVEERGVLTHEVDVNEGWEGTPSVFNILHSGGGINRRHTHFEALLPFEDGEPNVSCAYWL